MPVAASSVTWPAIVAALLGSGALGSIVGGYTTTRLRASVERDEAWRTRLVDSSHAFLTQFSKTVAPFRISWLVAAEEGQPVLHTESGSPTGELQRALAHLGEEFDHLVAAREGIEIVYGRDESFDEAVLAVGNLDAAAALLRGDDWIRREMELTLASGPSRLGITSLSLDDGSWPDDFDADDDSDVAFWVRILVESAADHRTRFVDACLQRIQSKHPRRQSAGSELTLP